MSCPQCFSGHVNPGTPKGREDVIHDLKTYIAEPPEGTETKGIIIMVPDAFGFPFINNRIWADHIASACGFRVYLPDFSNGNAAPLCLIDMMDSLFSSQTALLWKAVYAIQVLTNIIPFALANRWSVVWPRITAFFKAVRENEGASLFIGAAGFCWGGLHTVYLAHDQEKAGNGKPLVDACFLAHPSQLSITSDIDKIKKPVSLAIGDKDFALSIKQIDQVKAAWAAKSDVETQVKVYADAAHGFAVRADHGTLEAVRKAEEAETQAVEWFKKISANVSY